MSASPACLAMAAGATDRFITCEWVIPGEVINNIVLNAKAIGEMGDVVKGGKAGDSEVYFDDPQERQERETGDGERYFDDPG